MSGPREDLPPLRRWANSGKERTFAEVADAWLASQTLTQLLYLLPPALLLSRNFGGAANSTVIVVLVLVILLIVYLVRRA